MKNFLWFLFNVVFPTYLLCTVDPVIQGGIMSVWWFLANFCDDFARTYSPYLTAYVMSHLNVPLE
jgi:hypothetical protein